MWVCVKQHDDETYLIQLCGLRYQNFSTYSRTFDKVRVSLAQRGFAWPLLQKKWYYLTEGIFCNEHPRLVSNQKKEEEEDGRWRRVNSGRFAATKAQNYGSLFDMIMLNGQDEMEMKVEHYLPRWSITLAELFFPIVFVPDLSTGMWRFEC